MTKLTVVGSIAFDAVETHAGKRDRMLGGSAVHFSLASSFFADTHVVGPVGDDFGDPEFDVLHGRGVNTDDIERDDLIRAIGMVDCLLLNDGEIKQLTDEPNLVRAARAALDLGPRVVIAKQGEYGSRMFTRDGVFALPAYP